jgi:hypothetical protein
MQSMFIVMPNAWLTSYILNVQHGWKTEKLCRGMKNVGAFVGMVIAACRINVCRY